LGTYRYSVEFRTDAVALARSSDRPFAQVARDLGVNHETLRQWVKAAEDPVAVAGDAKDAEIARLRRQVRELESEREILRKAARYFARETGW
jgi:transposase